MFTMKMLLGISIYFVNFVIHFYKPRQKKSDWLYTIDYNLY